MYVKASETLLQLLLIVIMTMIQVRMVSRRNLKQNPMSYLPLQVVFEFPSNLNPDLQVQVGVPFISAHTALTHTSVKHGFSATRKVESFMVSITYTQTKCFCSCNKV